MYKGGDTVDSGSNSRGLGLPRIAHYVPSLVRNSLAIGVPAAAATARRRAAASRRWWRPTCPSAVPVVNKQTNPPPPITHYDGSAASQCGPQCGMDYRYGGFLSYVNLQYLW